MEWRACCRFRGDLLDEELVVLLKKAGMYRCMVAVESASPRIQKVMKKHLKIDKIVDFIGKQGVMVHGAFMLGLPSETAEELQSTIDGAARSSFHTAARKNPANSVPSRRSRTNRSERARSARADRHSLAGAPC